jgi:hypothetical protein
MLERDDDRPAPLVDRDEEIARWQVFTDRNGALLDDPRLTEYVVERLTLCIAAGEPGADEEGWDEREALDVIDVQRRHLTALVALLSVTPGEFRPMVVAGIVGDHYTNHVREWFKSVVQLGSRIPPDLKPDVAAELLTVYRDRPGDVDGLCRFVCVECGLLRPKHKSPPIPDWVYPAGHDPAVVPIPYRLPAFAFEAACPHCGAAGTMWSIRTLERDYPWREKAVAELAMT